MKDNHPAVGPADLAADTTVTATATQGLYTAQLPDHWDFRYPSGGVVLTVALRAIAAQIADPAYRPRSATTAFCSPVPNGPLTIRVDILRRGRAAVQAHASLRSPETDSPGLDVTAVFMREIDGPDVLEARFPDVPGPDDCEPLEHPFGRFFRNFEIRLARGQVFWLPDWQPGPARFSRWWRYHTPQRDADGVLDPLAIPPIADTMPASLHQRLGPDGLVYYAPSLDLTMHFIEDTRADWLLTHSYTRRARAGFATAEVEVWSDDGTLVAYGTQTMMLRKRKQPRR